MSMKKHEVDIAVFRMRSRLDAHELSVLMSLLYISLPAEQLIRQASKEIVRGDHGESSSESECQDALARLLARGLVQEVSRRSLMGMQLIVHQQNILGPIVGWPKVGSIDMTEEGAKIARRIMRAPAFGPKIIGWGATRWINNHHVQVFNISVKAIRDDLAELLGNYRKEIQIARPVSTGPWLDRWWLRFRYGVCVDIRGELEGLNQFCKGGSRL